MSISLHIQRVRTQRDLSGALKHFAQLGLIFRHHQQKIQNFFDMLITKTPGVNMIARQNSLSCIRWYFPFLHFRTFKIQFFGVPHSHYALACKIHSHAKDYIFKLVNIYILSLPKIFYTELLVCDMSYFQFDTTLAPILWTIGTSLKIHSHWELLWKIGVLESLKK